VNIIVANIDSNTITNVEVVIIFDVIVANTNTIVDVIVDVMFTISIRNLKEDCEITFQN